jgi:hypothetical protein
VWPLNSDSNTHEIVIHYPDNHRPQRGINFLRRRRHQSAQRLHECVAIARSDPRVSARHVDPPHCHTCVILQRSGVVDAPFTFQVPQADGVVDFMSQNFPNLYRTYEVRFFGESFSFYDRQYDQGQSMTLSKLTANEAVFSIYETPFEGYYSVLNYTLTR